MFLCYIESIGYIYPKVSLIVFNKMMNIFYVKKRGKLTETTALELTAAESLTAYSTRQEGTCDQRQ